MKAMQNSARLRLLTLGPQPVWPATDGGKEGILGAVCGLARRADVIYACPDPNPSRETRQFYEKTGIDYRPVPFEPHESMPEILLATLQLEPYKFAKYGNRAAVAAFAARLHDVAPDAIICFHAHMMKLGQRLRARFGWNVPIVLREHNIEYELVTSYRQSLSFPKQIFAFPFEWLTRRAEQGLWATADTTAFLSDRDFTRAIETGTVANGMLAREGVPIPERRDLASSIASRKLLITLNPRAVQSVANVRRFLHEYWKEVALLDRLGGVSLAITGVDAARLSSLTGISPSEQHEFRIEALGFLPRLETAFEMANALVSPTFVGGGIRKKVLEGMAHQLPVLATDLDIETCSFFDPPNNILPFGSPIDFAMNVQMLMNDSHYWQKLSDAGRATVERFATWDGFAEAVTDRIQDLRLSARGIACAA